MKKQQIDYPQDFRCEQVADREREHWLEAMADSSTRKGKVNQMSGQIEGTEAQRSAYATLKERWDNVGEPTHLIGDGRCWMVVVSSNETGAKMELGIEPNGYTHG